MDTPRVKTMRRRRSGSTRGKCGKGELCMIEGTMGFGAVVSWVGPVASVPGALLDHDLFGVGGGQRK